MGTSINVIVAKNRVYATYVKTICFVGEFNGESEHDGALITRAQSIAFSYGQNFGNVYLKKIEMNAEMNDQDVFNYLERN